MRIEPPSPPHERPLLADARRQGAQHLVIAKRPPDGESVAAAGAAERPRIIHHLDLDFAVVGDGMQKAT